LLLVALSTIAFANDDVEVQLLDGYEVRSNELSDTGNGYLVRDIDIVYRNELEEAWKFYLMFGEKTH
jgi:hypothetical protein